MKRLLIISAILPATYLCLLTFIFIPRFTNSDLSEILIAVSLLLGIVGYIGLWQSLLKEQSKWEYLNTEFLIAGILGALTFLIYARTSINLSLGLLLFLWPVIVSVIILIDKFKMLKRKTTSANNL